MRSSLPAAGSPRTASVTIDKEVVVAVLVGAALVAAKGGSEEGNTAEFEWVIGEVAAPESGGAVVGGRITGSCK